MGDTKLCLLLLLSTYALAQQVDSKGGSPTCLLDKRFQNFRRYVYNYDAETHNGVHGATSLKNGPKVYCKVEIDVVQTCNFIVRTSECSLSEVSAVDSVGSPVYEPSANAETFQFAMEKNPLKVMVEGETGVKLFPEENEPATILNIKRGIVSALLVPSLKVEKNVKMATLHGVCDTDNTVNARENDVTDLTLTRDLSRCDSFTAQKDHTSPLALISGMHFPLSKLISSTQTCNYQFSNEESHILSGACTEKHIFLPFSHQNEYGVSTVVKQIMTLVESENINDRVFDPIEANLKFLPMETVEEKNPVQTKDSIIATMGELTSLSQTNQGHQRASTFQKLVMQLRGLKAEVMSDAVVHMMDMSGSLTWQALAQCGTPECSSTMLQVLRTFDVDAIEVDAAVYALGLLPNPSRLLVKDMLAMAQYKQSKPIMYALSNVVRKLYQAKGNVTPEITAVSEFMASILGSDCAGEKELTFLTLRVVGNMGEAMEAADASVKTTLVKCMRQPATTLSVQLAAIQAFRHMSVTNEVRSNLQRVSQYAKGAVQKRLAAYLILMRAPEDSDLELVKKVLTQDQNMQVKAFVASHIYNIISSKDSETQKMGKKILDVMGENDVTTDFDYTKSRNYKMETGANYMQTDIRGNMVFDPTSQLPREVMLEMTLNAFGYSMDMWEVGMEGKGFEPTIEALFGKNGFFPDTLSKTMYWAEDKMPNKINEVLEKWIEPLMSEKLKRQVPENIVREIVRNFNKLAKELQTQESPEATAYLRIMGAELGYIKGTDLKGIVDTAVMYAEILFKTIPTKTLQQLMSSTDNELFAHYIFMDNSFSLPTAAGLPLKFALSGTFVPGVKGGLHIAPNMQEVSFMPSLGVEFVTQMGVHMPEFVVSAIEMHTNMYHESTFNAKVTMEQNQVKLAIPAPQGTTQLFRVSNRVLTVTTGHVSLVPPMEDYSRTNVVNCSPLFSGVKYCTTVRYSIAGVNAAAPYFPLNGETKFAVDIQPTGEVTEYTATFSYELLSEGKDGRQKVDSLKMIMKAEGSEPTEATATMKYNRNKNVFTTNVQIPDYDVEAGVRVGLTDSSTKGKSITIEISNKNIPQLSLIGRAKLEAMTDGMLQVQLVVPSLQTDAAVTATLRNVEGLTLEIKSDVKLPETSSVQGVIFKYGEDQVQVQLMSDMNSEIHKLLPYTEDVQNWLILLSEDIMDHKVAKTDMKLRHIYTKALEASSMWLDKITTDVPAFETLKNNMPEIVMPSMPEKLFLKSESTFRYQFNKDRVIIIIPIPLGGKSSEELRIPALLTTPHLAVPQMGLDLPSKEIQVPTFSIPSNYDLTLPLMGMVEVSAKVNSNYYNWEAMISAGNNSIEDPSYMVQYKVMADSPIELFSYTTEGTALITDIPEDTMKAIVNASLSHKLIDTSFGIMESVSVSDKVKATGNYKIQAFSPLGLQTSLDITSQCSLAADIFIGDANIDGSLTVGSLTASTTYSQSFSVEPMKKEARAESTLRMDAPMLEFVNKIKAGYADEQLLIESNTNMNNDPMKHTTKFSIGYKEAQLTIQSDSVTKADERMLRSQVDFTATRNEASIRMENQADDTQNRVYSLVSASLNPSSLEINADASINVFASRASHKATLTLNKDSLATSCTTTAQSSPVTFENIIHGGFDTTGASMSINTKGAIQENTAELNVEGKVSTSELYMNSMYKGNLFDANTRNRVNLRMNEDGLIISNSLVASLQDMKTDNKHSMTLTLGSLAVRSKTDNFLSDSNSYKHDITIDIERFTAFVVVNNDLKIMDVHFVNEAEFKAEPYNMDLTGSVKGTYSEDELKHTYEISFTDMTSTAKCNTNGKLMGSQMSHNTDMELSGLTMKFNSLANFNSPLLRLDSTIHTVAEPFTLNVDAIFNSNSELNFYGKQTGEVYSKFLLKAEPLSFSYSHECRASTTHKLESGTSIETNMDNKFNSLITTKEQSVTFKTTSKLNKHAFDQEITAYNKPEKLGVEMTGTFSTTVLSKASENQDYSISGFVKYDKNSDSHLLQIPFIEHLPAVIEQVKATIMGVMDNSIELLKDIDSKYEIRVNLQAKVNGLKQVIATFDINLFIQDLKHFINSMVNHMTGLMSKLPHAEFKNLIKSVKDTISDFFVEFNIPNTKLEELLTNYEVDKMIESVMDEAVEIMKHLQLREHIQSAIAALKSIDIQPFLNKVMTPVEEFVNQLSTFDFKHMFEDMNVYFSRLVQKIKSFDYETFTEELKEKITDMSKIPCFGKLNGEFRLISPDYSLRTTAELQNSTTASESPELTVNLNSQATSTFDLIAYTLDATAHVVRRTSQLSLSETIKVVHTSFSFDHEGTMGFYGTSAEASSKTTAKATTEPYKAELVNSAIFTTGNGVSATLETAYNHEVNMPLLEIFSETSHTQKTFAFLENGVITLTLGHEGRGKFAIQEYGDEGTQKSDMEITVNFHDIKLTFTGETNTNHVQMKQNVQAEFCIYGQINIEASAETKTPFITSSVAELKGEAKVQDMKIEITASHNTELVGNVEGTISNSLTALITPYELMFDIKNKENTKVKLPFKLSGKIDLQNDFAVTLNSGVQQCSWVGHARFNQYKYSHYFTMDNGEKEIHIFAQINGEANLDVLKEPITIPEMSVPFLSVKTSAVEDYSLWEDTGLSMLLTTTQQTFDMESKIVYKKNPDMLTIDLDLQPVVSAINKNTRMLNKNIIIGKDKVVALLTISLDQAKAEYEKYNIELPKTLTVPAYKVPVMNIEVSSFTIPLPDASLITMPALHVPSALSKLTLPKITLPKMQRSIKIPVMGDLTYEFSMKTPVVTLKTDASIINQHEIVIKLDATSTSDFKVLTGKIEGTSTLNRDNGVKLSSVLSVKHMIIDSNHDSTIIFSNEAVDASITNSAKVGMSALMIEANQELFANAQDGLIVSLSSPSSGLLGLQLLTKRPAQVKGRLYSRYPSDPTNDVDIMSIKMSVIDSAMLNIQTTWNMEVPNEMMLGLKENIPTIVSTVTLQDIVNNPICKAYNEITRLASNLEGPLEQIKEEGRIMFKRAADNFEALGLADLTEKVSESMIYVLKEYEEKIQILLNAVIEFLRETQFQLPGFEDKLSGLEVYRKFTSFITDVTEEAITKVPEFVAARSETVHRFITNIQIPIPDFRKEGFVSSITFEELQRILIDIVQTIRTITLEDIVEIVNKSNRFCIQKLEGLNWMSDIYTDFVNSRGLSSINTQVENFRNMAEAYFSDIHTNFQAIFADMSIEQLNADIQSWIGSVVKRLNAFHNMVIEFLKEISKHAESYVRVSDRRIEIDIPFSDQAD
ncbi:apolipoprotein B-100-like isoform X1 [Osmerus eperlanus]|uniref:apolipoprotein B-100-like isoform X1 n=2 Tax=Osmerus eperlanus TaxID=29151 RepID=UPI002E12B337